MDGTQDRFTGDVKVLHQRAVRIPLPDMDAERLFHENMMTIAAARERKADLLADPGVSVLDAYEAERERIGESFERRLRRIAGDEYEEAAMAYNRGDRDDRVGALAAYDEAGRRLREDLGLDPSPALRDMQAKILRQDASLEAAELAPDLEGDEYRFTRNHLRRSRNEAVHALREARRLLP
jgi:DNA-binding SARP family transcriptional activator